MKIFRAIILQLITFFIFAYTGFSQSIEISVGDTVINRSKTVWIPVNFKFDKPVLEGLISFEFIYNAMVIDIKEFNTQVPTNPIIESIIYSNNLNDLTKAILTVEFRLKQSTSLGTFYIELEGLAAADTSTLLTPVSAKLDSNDFQTSKFSEGLILVRSLSVVPGISEGLGQNRPNPFSDYTNFNIGLNKESKISFSIYGTGGHKLFDDDNLLSIFKVTFLNESGEVIEDYRSIDLPRGNYLLSLQPISWMLASGNYFIVLTTSSGVYKSNFMYIK